MTTVRKIVRNVVALHPEDPLDKAWAAMREQGLPGLPVVDGALHLTGVLTEDDLLVRCIGRKPLGWWATMIGEPDRLANSYRQAVGTTVADLVGPVAVSIDLDAQLAEAATLMRDHRVRVLPVIAGDALAGVVTASDLVDALGLPSSAGADVASDAELVEEMQRRLESEPWASRYRIHVTVQRGILELTGLVNSGAERAAILTMARTIPGCAGVEDYVMARSEILRNVSRHPQI